MSKLLNVSSSPHMRSRETTHSIVLDVAIAMLSASASGAYHFGLHALLVSIVTAAVCMLNGHVYKKLMHKPCTLSDCSALVIEMILALSMPPEIPVWIPALGGIFAVIMIEQLYGDLGQNLVNPAPATRCFLLISFAGEMTNFSYSDFDSISGTTPLAVLKSGGKVDIPAMSIGNIPGTIGEVSVIALLVGAAYLLFKKVISIRIPRAYIFTVVIFAMLSDGRGFDMNYVLAHLCGDELIFGAFFMATGYATNPITSKGQTVFGILLDVLIGLFRIFDGSAKDVSYAIIINSIPVPLIEKVTLPKAFGKEGK